MKAVVWEALGASPFLKDVPEPVLGSGRVLVRVHSSSVNPVDNAVASGMLKDMVPHEFPIIPGRDYSGVVEAVGEGVAAYAPGDEVFGFVPMMTTAIHDGAWAELIVVPESMAIGRKPAGVDFQVAGAAPLAAIAALAAIDALDPSEGHTVLIVGATGGLGHIAVQLAAAAGATVIAPGLPEDEGFLRELGAAEVPSREGDIAGAVRQRHPEGVDAILDAVSYAPGTYDAALKKGGRVASPNRAAGEGPGRYNVSADPTTENIERVGRLLAEGRIQVYVQRIYPLERAPQAMQDMAGGHLQGKLGLQIAM